MGCERISSTSFASRNGEDSKETSVACEDDGARVVLESESEKPSTEAAVEKVGEVEAEERVAPNEFTGQDTERANLRGNVTVCDSSK